MTLIYWGNFGQNLYSKIEGSTFIVLLTMIWGRKRSYRSFVTVVWWLASYQRHLSLHMLAQFLMQHRRVLTARWVNWLKHLVLCCTGKFSLSRRCGGWGKFSIWYWHYKERTKNPAEVGHLLDLYKPTVLAGRLWQVPLKKKSKRFYSLRFQSDFYSPAN